MMKLQKCTVIGGGRKLALSVVCAVGCLAVSADTFRWLGKFSGESGPIDWSDTTRWTNVTAKVGGVLPGTGDDVIFASTPKFNIEFDVTPPADFAGTIAGEKYDTSWGLMARITVTPAEGAAAYRLTGPCVFVANDSLAAHIDPGFTGCIEIPAGVSFTATADIPDAVDFMGPGDLVLAKASQLQHIAGVTGRIDARPLGSLSASDLSLLEGHVVTLPGSVTLETDRMFGVTEKLDDWNVPGAWGSFHGVTERNNGLVNGGNYIPTGHGPQVCADGSLLLTDDFLQENSCVMTNRWFEYDDVWCVKYTWQSSQPADSHYRTSGQNFWTGWGQYFGGALMRNDPTVLPKTSANGVSCGPSNAVCFRIYGYAGGTRGVGFHNCGSGTGISDDWTSLLADSTSGLKQGSPVDITVSYRKGNLFTTIEQPGMSRTFRYSALSVIGGTNRCYYGVYGITWEALWQYNRVSNFRGWKLSRNGGQWKELSGAYPITAANWDLTAYSGALDDEHKIEGADLILANGAYKLLEGKNLWNGRAVCKTPLPTDRRLRIDYDILWGSQADRGGEGFHFGFVNTATPTYQNSISGWVDPGGNSPANWSYFYYNNLTGFTVGDKSASNAGNYVKPGEYANGTGPKGSNRSANCSLFYDGTNTLYGNMRCSSVNEAVNVYGQFPAFATRYPNGMYMRFYGACASWNCYIRTDIANLRVMEWDDTAPGVATLFAPLAVADGEAVTLTTGDASLAAVELGTNSTLTVAAKGNAAAVSVGAVRAAGAATLAASAGTTLACGPDVTLAGETPHGVTVSGDVSFGNCLAFTIPAAWRAGMTGSACLLDARSASGTIPTTLTLAQDDGTALSSKFLRTYDGRVMLNFCLGTQILIR